jgi:putative MATE family efflux protein
MRSLGTFLAFGTVAIFCTSMVDVYFVSKLGAHALAALSFTFPIYLLVTAFSSGLGNGVVAVIARAVGSGDRAATKELGTDALLLTVSMGALIGLVGLTTIRPLFRALGADEDVLALIADYMYVWYLGIVLVIFPQVSQTIARAHGDARTPTFFMWAMSITNMALDPVFIFGWGPVPALGLRGSALAAIVARGVYVIGMIWLLIPGLGALAPIHLSISRLLNSWKRLLHVGLPAIASQMVQPFSTALLTRIVAMSGSAAVAAFGVGSRIEMVTAIYLWGVAGALPPFVGQNAGAHRMDRVRNAIGIAIKFCIGAGIALFAIAMIAGNEIVGHLTNDAAVRSLAVFYFRVIALGYALNGLVLIASQAMNALHRPLPALMISICRAIAVTLPAALVGQWLAQIHGVFIGISAAGAVCGAAAWVLLISVVRQESRRQELQSTLRSGSVTVERLAAS